MISLLTLILILDILVCCNNSVLFWPTNYKRYSSTPVFTNNKYASLVIFVKDDKGILYKIPQDSRDFNYDYCFICFLVMDIKYIKKFEIVFDIDCQVYNIDKMLKEARSLL